MKSFYSVEEMAEATGYSVGTVRNWIAQGSLHAIQSRRRGAFRIPIGSYQKRLGELGLAPKLSVKLLPETEAREVTAEEFYRDRIAPRLAEAGFSDVPSLLAAMERDTELYASFGGIASDYVRYLEERSARQPALA